VLDTVAAKLTETTWRAEEVIDTAGTHDVTTIGDIADDDSDGEDDDPFADDSDLDADPDASLVDKVVAA